MRAGSLVVRGAAALACAAVVACASDPSAPRVIDQLPRQLSAAEQQVISGGNGFAFSLLREVDRTHAGKNVVISPLSASMALGMTLNGARTTTFDGMRHTLGLGDLEQPAINEGYRDVITLLRGLDPRVEMQIANSIWFAQGFPVEQSFLDVTAEFFGARAEPLDFTSPAAVSTINGWVKQATRDRIPTLLDRIEGAEIMFLINAIYFKGLWTEPFERSRTRDAAFRLASGATVQVPMMTREGTIAVAYDADLVMLDLPYGGSAFSMTLLMPREESSLTAEQVVTEMTSARWSGLVEALAPSRLFLDLPRFKIEWRDELDDALGALGMAEAFDARAADFSGISQAVYDAGERLYITRVVQKTFIAVDEAGTEAAAATAVGIAPTSAPPYVKFDRPFLFAIRERLSGTILFVGKIADPSQRN